MQDFDEEQLKEIHMGRLIQVLSHQMKRKSCVNSMINDDGLTTMQKHVLKFLLLETLHKVVYQSETHHSYKESGSTPSEHPCTHKAVGNTAYDRYFRS